MAGRSQILMLQRRIDLLRRQNFVILQDGVHAPPPADFAQAVLGTSLDDWQLEYILNAQHEARVAIAASRQSGKSTVAALYIAWCLLYIDGITVIVASRSLRQAAYFLDKVRDAVMTMVPFHAMRTLNRLSMALPNNSQIISIPCAQPDAGRGFSPHLLLLDEAAFAPDALFTAITPSLAATNGAMHMISSPNGRVGNFFSAFEGEAQDVFWTKRVTYRDCPRINEETLIRERIFLGDARFRQEYGAEFISAEGAFFGPGALDEFLKSEPQDLSLLELEEMADAYIPVPTPNVNDLMSAFDRAQRVSTELR
jgi:hypothetical protein